MIAAGLEFPDDLFYDIGNQVWARLEADGTATVGITALGTHLSGEVYMCRAKPVGVAVAKGRAVAVVELAKSIVSVKSPVTGVVVEVNPRLVEEPHWVHRDPYGRGWIARLAPDDFPSDRSALLHGTSVGPAMAEHARLFRADS